jgi:hypothetical protein
MHKNKTFITTFLSLSLISVLSGCTPEDRTAVVTFETYGGTAVSEMIVNKNTIIEEPYTTKTGHSVEGWYLSSEYTSRWNFQTNKVTQHTTLHVKWNIDVTNISLQYNQIGLVRGENYTLNPIISPANASNKTVTWSTSNPSIATVNSSGVVTAVGLGKATITARSSNNLATYATVTIFYDVNQRTFNEVEPNNTRTSANTITQNGTTVYGRNSAKSDIDYYKVYLTANDYFNIVFASNYAVDAQYYLIGLENASGTVLRAIYGTQTMSYLVPTSGNYYIGVLYSSSSPWSNGDTYGMYLYWF